MKHVFGGYVFLSNSPRIKDVIYHEYFHLLSIGGNKSSQFDNTNKIANFRGAS
jgi:hypothetical protein